MQGVVVKAVEHGGPSENKLGQNDIITAVIFPGPRTPIRSADDLQRVLSRLKSGDYVGLSVSGLDMRNEVQSRIVNIRLGN
jgi:PDZ domain-containing secreted protein